MLKTVLQFLGLKSKTVHDDFFGELKVWNSSLSDKNHISLCVYPKFFKPIKSNVELILDNNSCKPSKAQKEAFKYFERNYDMVCVQINSFIQKHHQEETQKFNISDVRKEFELHIMRIEEENNDIICSFDYCSKSKNGLNIDVNFIKLEIDFIEIYSL